MSTEIKTYTEFEIELVGQAYPEEKQTFNEPGHPGWVEDLEILLYTGKKDTKGKLITVDISCILDVLPDQEVDRLKDMLMEDQSCE